MKSRTKKQHLRPTKIAAPVAPKPRHMWKYAAYVLAGLAIPVGLLYNSAKNLKSQSDLASLRQASATFARLAAETDLSGNQAIRTNEKKYNGFDLKMISQIFLELRDSLDNSQTILENMRLAGALFLCKRNIHLPYAEDVIKQDKNILECAGGVSYVSQFGEKYTAVEYHYADGTVNAALSQPCRSILKNGNVRYVSLSKDFSFDSLGIK